MGGGHNTRPPLNHTKTEMVHTPPKFVVAKDVVQKQMGTSNPFPLAKQQNHPTSGTKVFDQVFQLSTAGETFSLPKV